MHAEFEPLAGVVRIFEDGNSYGDPYVWISSIRFINNKTVEIVGTLSAPKPSTWKAILRMAQDMGIERIIFTRKRKDGTQEIHEVDVKKKR